MIRAENYIYNQNSADKIIVGSSVSAGLDDVAPEDWYVLSMQGESSATGLEIVLRSKKVPSVILVEMNVLERGVNNEKVNQLFSVARYSLAKFLPSFQNKNRISRILWKLPSSINEFQKNLRGIKTDISVQIKTDNLPSPEVVEQLLQERLIKFQKPLPKEVLNDNLSKLKSQLTELKAKGSSIYLFRLPEHPSIYSTTRMKQFIQTTDKSFSKTDWNWLPDANPNDFTTNDGQHLTYKSLAKYAEYLFSRLNQIQN
ncbi:MAG: hypothetical protein MI748_12790 [Opitutales bacterium]|nr:hypothetical protein [Opitutales bacterium]